VNVSNAAIFGLQHDLKLTGLQYSNCLVIFFVPYVLFEIPSNYAIKRFRPSTWLPLCMLLFGFTSIMQGLIKGYGGFLATRFFLGLFEVRMSVLSERESEGSRRAGRHVPRMFLPPCDVVPSKRKPEAFQLLLL
jgi:MFS family permease